MNEVIPGLWIGGKRDLRYVDRFDLVVMAAPEVPTPWRGARILRVDLDDVLMDWQALRLVVESPAAVVAQYVRAGANVLVTCHMGLNRSALVVGAALRHLGVKNPVPLIRAKRLGALSNPAFVRYLG